MRILIDSNFSLFGLKEVKEIHLDSPKATLRMVLEELAKKNPDRVTLINPFTGAVDAIDFILEINGRPNTGSKEDLEVNVNEGDMVSVKITLLDGG